MTFRDLLKAKLEIDLGFGFYRRNGILKKFKILAKSPGILCGMIFVQTLVDIVEKEFFLEPLQPAHEHEGHYSFPVEMKSVVVISYKNDGDEISAGDVVAELYGDSEVLLKAERHICDMLARLSGIATYTRKRVKEIGGAGAALYDKTVLLDTRKGNPFDRMADKYALTEIGGAVGHRAGFYDGTLIKDNDIKVFGGIREAIGARSKETRFLTKVEIEVANLEELEEVLADGRVDVILLDNMHPGLLREAVRRIRSSGKRYWIEASGIGDNSLREVAETGVDAISISSLVTKGSAEKVDISMKVVSERG